MKTSITRGTTTERSGLYKASLGIYVLVTAIGCVCLGAVMPLPDAITMFIVTAGPALALSLSFRIDDMSMAYVFFWAAAVMTGGCGIAAALFLG
jgi:hypothetical protein